MSKINVMRTDLAMPSPAALEGARALLFGALDGLSASDKKAWRRMWGKLVKMEPGEMSQVEIVIPRNGKFHRKFMAMLQLGFDSWDGNRVRKTYKGRPVSKNFERFRKDVIILAGFYDQTFDLHGRMELEAKSISFANMDDPEFEKVYNAVADVLLQEVLTKYSGRAELDSVVEKMMGFIT